MEAQYCRASQKLQDCTPTDSREKNTCSTRDAQSIYSTKLEAKYGHQQGKKMSTYYIHSVEYIQTNQIQHTGSTDHGNQVGT